ncbi:MAG: glycosyltransferase family 2 protein [Flammeovirgaceae bacterium]
MKVSIITVCYNAASTIVDAIHSVRQQDYEPIEYIVVDGNSTDGTVDVIQQHHSDIDRWVSEPDKGIYDAMNKGVAMATGDVVGILNSDDFYSSQSIISQVARQFENPDVDAVFGDLVIVDPKELNKVVRKYSARQWNPQKLAWGFMPPHPTFFVRKKFYEDLGLYKTDYRISSDYELMIRFLLVHKLRYKYIPLQMVTMRKGGVSSRNIKSNIILNEEIVRACNENGVRTNRFMIYSKYFKKIGELF